MPDESFQCYLKAGSIANKVRRRIAGRVVEGRSIIDICTMVEEMIRELGGTPAFPCNVGVDEIAAHYTSNPGDTQTIPTGSLVKLDFGVAVEGYIADTAISLTENPRYVKMIDAAEDALSSAIKSFRPGVRLSDIGSIISRTVRGLGFQPIQNLSGHMMERYTLHAGKSVPNVATGDHAKILEGEVYAIEPFVTTLDGAGRVIEGEDAYIYRFVKEKGVKSDMEKSLIREIRKSFRTLPFTIRWLKQSSKPSFAPSFANLLKRGNVFAYPVLKEAWAKPVAQAEHTVVVTAEGCQVLTL